MEVSERWNLTWIHAFSVLLGGLLALSSVIFHFARMQERHIVVGVAIMVISGIYVIQFGRGESPTIASEWMIGLLGVMILAASMGGGVRAGILLRSDVLSGGLVIIISSYVVYSTRRTYPMADSWLSSRDLYQGRVNRAKFGVVWPK
jgi:hypothetical protein